MNNGLSTMRNVRIGYKNMDFSFKFLQRNTSFVDRFATPSLKWNHVEKSDDKDKSDLEGFQKAAG